MLDLNDFYSYHQNVIRGAKTKKKRYLLNQIDFDQNAVLVYGFRGVGKTTLLIQYGKENYKNIQEWLYLSADFYRVADYSLYELVDAYFSQKPGKAIVIDEVQKFENWKVQLKNVLDAFKDKKILISGSSSIELNRADSKHASLNVDADIERRVSKYLLKPLSFREFLYFNDKADLAAVSLAEITQNNQDITENIVQKIGHSNTVILDAFTDYLRYGCYPFYYETGSEVAYRDRLNRLVSEILESDIGMVLNLKMEKIIALKKLFSTIASSKPFKPNIDKLSTISGLSRPTVYEYLHYLHMAGLSTNLYENISKARQITSKPEKICVANPNLLLCFKDHRIPKELVGAVRESFFVSCFGEKEITSHPKADYRVGELVFEIGGKGKDKKQIQGVDSSFLVQDGIEISYNDRIVPLYLFGFLY